MKRSLLVDVALLCMLQQVFSLDQTSLQQLKNDLRSAIKSSPDFNQPLLAGCLRLSFHDCVGGKCDGCVDLDNPDNAGLKTYINELDQKVNRISYGISRADLWALCGIVAAEIGAENTPSFGAPQPMPNITFLMGRVDKQFPCPPRTFPTPTEDPVQFLKAQFPGLDDRLAVALLGAHSCGRAHSSASGFSGPWTVFPNWLDNEYYRNLLDPKFNWKQDLKSNNLHQWTGNSGGRSFMMLHADVLLHYDLQFPEGSTESTCGFPVNGKPECSIAEYSQYVEEFAADNVAFMNAFGQAFSIMINSGNTLTPVPVTEPEE